MCETNVSSLFVTPFSPDYWRAAISELKKTRVIALAALLVAVEVVISSVRIPVADNLYIYLSFFVKALGAMIYGPVVGLLTGFAGDILGYFLHSFGEGFFPGYTLTSMAGAFLYGLFFYRARLSFVRVLCCKLCVNLFVNIGLGALWSSILYNKGYLYYLVKSITKNALLLVPEAICLFLFFNLMLPVMERAGIIPKQPKLPLPFV